MQNEAKQFRSWAEVSSSEKFLSLSPEHQERARELYYQDNVAPRVPQGMEQRAREMFDQDTAASSAMGMQIPDRQGGIEVMDYVKEAGAGVLTGTGAMISGVGDAVRHDPMGRQPVETPKGDFMPLTSRIGNALDPITRPVTDAIDGPARAVGGWISGKGQELSDSKTEAAKQALQASTPAGDITSPTTWSMGEDPSIAGYGLHAANLAGQFAPQAGAIAATRGRSIQTPVMMGVGGLQAGGSAADEVEERITAAADVELQESSTLYKQLRESMSEPEARQTLVAKARNAAFGGAAPIGAFGGLATQAVFGPVQRAIGGTVGRRLAGSIAVDAPLEGVQEVLESTESRRATNKALGEQQSLTEDTFGDFALGAMGGAGQASAGTAVSVASGKSGLSGTAPAGTVDQNDPFHIPDDPDAPGAAQQYAVDSLDPSNAQYQDNRQRPDLQQTGLRMPGDQTVQQQTGIASNEDPSRTAYPSKQIAPPMGLEFNEVQQAPKPAAQKLPQDQAKYSWDSMNTFERNKAAQDTLGYADADVTEAAAKAWDQLVPQDQQKLADAMTQDSSQRWDAPNQKISDKDRPVLQNRDRTTTASIAQMQDIRNNPDYTRLSFSRDFGNGAPVVEPGAEFPTAQLGLTERAVTSVGRKIPVQYAAIEADQLLPSNDALGNSIPEYATGVEGKSRAIAGNGRIAGIAAAWKSGKAKAYKQEMIKDGQHGIDPDVIRAMKQPVLVRIMPLSEVSNNIGDESNVSGQAGLSPTEQANTDMRRIDLAELRLTEDNELSEDTVLDFIKGMPKSELGTLLTKSGRPTAEAFARAEVALFQQAYQNETLTENLVDLKGDAKFIMNALMRAAPAMAKLEGAGIYDIRPLVSEAAEVAVNARRQGIKLNEFIKMGDFGRNPQVMPILEMMIESGQRTTAIGDKLISLAQMAYTEANKAGQDMFGEVVKQSPEALMKKAFSGEQTNVQESTGSPEALGNKGRPRLDASNVERRPTDGTGQTDSGEIQADQRGAKSEAAEARLKKKTAEKKASTEPTTEKWRKNYLLAKKRATELGIDPKEHGKLPGLVKAIDAAIDGQSPTARYNLKDKTKPQVEAAAKEFTDTAKKHGGREAFDRARSEGKTKLNYQQWVQVRTPAFIEWFGDWENAGRERIDKARHVRRAQAGSKQEAAADTREAGGREDRNRVGTVLYGAGTLMDLETGEPRVFYHGTSEDIKAFNLNHPTRKDSGWLGRGVYVASDVRMANTYANTKNGSAAPNVMPVFIRSTSGLYQATLSDKQVGSGLSQENIDKATEALKQRGYDGAYLEFQSDNTIELVTYSANNIKSASGNAGTFDGTNPDIRYKAPLTQQPQAVRVKAGAITDAIASTPELKGVKVVESFEDLPAAVRKRIATDGIKPSDLSGVYMNGSTYVVADSHTTVADAVRTAVHEEVGHLGIRGLLGDKLTPTMERIYSSMAATVKGRKLIAGIRSNYASAAEGMSTKEQHQMIAEELVAHLLETGDKPTLVQRFVSKIRELLRAIFPQVKWTDSDVLALGEHSRKWLRTKNGENVPGMRYSLKEDSQQRNSGLFDDNGGYKREARPTQGRLDTDTQQDGSSIDLPDETAFRKHQRRWQDKLNRFTVIREWLADRGVELGENADVYLAEERMHSRFTNKTTDFREGTVKPLVEKIQKAGYTMEDVSQFLHAQHAQERNAQIAKINRNMPDGGSGMKNAEARAILAAADQKLVRVANELRAITDSTRKVLIDSGLISQEQADAWQKSYQYYVPLKGGPDDNASKAGTGKGLKTEHKTKRALGHDVREEGEWIIENILADHERALLSAEKNTVGKHLLKMAMDIGIDSIMTVGKPEKRGVLRNQVSYEVLYKGRPVGAFDTLEGAKVFKMSAPLTIGKAASPTDITIRKTSDPSVVYMASPMPALNEAMVYIKGDIIRVQINDELLARAYGNIGADALGTLLRSAQALNRWFSSVYTGYSPEFLIVNVTRDFTTGLANITGEEGALFATKAVKNYFSSFGALLKYAHKGVDNKWIRMYREDGGNTGAAYLSDLERLGTDMQTEYAVYQGVLANLRKGETKVAVRAAMRKAFNATLRHIEALNEAGENSMRLALYRTAVEQGMSRNKAASMSKNTTVNFNRKGEMGAQANALYLFFNATVQGTASISHAHFKGKHKKQAWALSGAMAALSYSLSLLSAGSDEEEYEKTSEYAKERNIVIPLGNGEAVTIPVPYGYGFFFTFGRLMADIQRTGDTDGAAWKLASAFTGEFLPFGGTMAGDEPDMVQVGTYMWPTIAQIPLSVANNRTSFGSPMRPENPNKRFEPDRLKMWRGTEGTWADALAGALESVGADVSPETLKHMSRTFGGGAGTFTGSVVDAIALGAQGAKPEIREIPIVRKFYRVNSVSDARSRFWRYQGETRKATEEFQRVIDSGDRGAVQEFVQGNRELIALGDVAKAFSEAAGATRDRVQEIRLGDLPVAKKREQIKKLEEKEAELYDRFVRIFKDKKG